jgi:hypothetical protein
MELSTLLKVKGVLTVSLGAIFLFFAAELVAAMGGELNEAGVIMGQLFGLLAMAVGWGMVVGDHAAPAGSEALAVVVTDTVAMTLLVVATNKGVLGAPALVLAAVYAGSALLYLYFYFMARKAR